MLDLRPVGYVIGLLVAILGATMFVPMAVDLIDGTRHWEAFFVSAVVTCLTGVLVSLSCHNGRGNGLTLQQTFLLTTGVWLALPIFGALPFDAPAPGVGILGLFSIGVFPILMGVTMWMQQKLNPAPTDKMQAQIFAWMPWIFMFMLGTFASGLVVYWVANNVLTFAQQYSIMRSQGVDVDFFGNVKKSFKRKPKEG